MKTRYLLVGLLLLGFAGMMIVGCGSKVTKDNYDKIKEGMTLKQVEDILGKGEAQAGGGVEVPGVSASAKVYQWSDGDKTITVTFLNDKVTAKAQTGL